MPLLSSGEAGRPRKRCYIADLHANWAPATRHFLVPGASSPCDTWNAESEQELNPSYITCPRGTHHMTVLEDEKMKPHSDLPRNEIWSTVEYTFVGWWLMRFVLVGSECVPIANVAFRKAFFVGWALFYDLIEKEVSLSRDWMWTNQLLFPKFFLNNSVFISAVLTLIQFSDHLKIPIWGISNAAWLCH